MLSTAMIAGSRDGKARKLKMSLGKRPCKVCSSSDAMELYENEGGRISAHCFSCGRTFFNIEEDQGRKQGRRKVNPITKEEVSTYPIRTDNDRGIYAETNERFGVRVSLSETNREPHTVWYPFFINKRLSGYKARVLPKDFECSAAGSIKNADLFGQQLCDLRSKKIIVTEGEEDCLTIAQVLWEHFGKKRWPNVVSLVNGANIGKNFEKEKKFLNQFDQIIVCFDNDEPGRNALTKLSQHIDIRKLYVLPITEKDANDCLLNGKTQELINGFTNPKRYRPAGILSKDEIIDRFLNRKQQKAVLYPDDWREFNEMTQGMRLGELDIFTGASSNGKTQILREIVECLRHRTKEKIGVIYLEESAEDTFNAIGSMVLKKRLYVPSVLATLTKEEDQKVVDVFKEDQIVIRGNEHDKMSDNDIFSSIMYMAQVEGCKYIIVDHLHMIVSESVTDSDSINLKTETIISKLKTYATTFNIWIGLAAHLRKQSNGILFEHGALAGMEDIKGSSAAYQRPDNIYFIQRNRTHSNEQMRNVSRLHVLKSRKISKCGAADFLQYDTDTGRMHRIDAPTLSIVDRKVRRTPNVQEDF